MENAASDVFSHSLDLSLRDKILFTVCAPFLVPFRILSAVLLAFLIWSSSRLGLLFTNPEVRKGTLSFLFILNPKSRSKLTKYKIDKTMPLSLIVS